ncbi:MAG: TrkA C-terminal domain-containing protein [Calditrichota bacterium]
MSFWDKLRKDLETTAQKAEQLFKVGAEAVKEQGEKVSAKASYLSKLAQINNQQRNLRDEVKREQMELGKLMVRLNLEKKTRKLKTEAAPATERIEQIEAKIAELEQSKKDLAEEYGEVRIEKSSVQGLVSDLENNGGTIMQLVVSADSELKDKKLKQIKLPKEVLIGMISRAEEVIIPDGTTTILEGDKVTLIGKREDVEAAMQEFETVS